MPIVIMLSVIMLSVIVMNASRVSKQPVFYNFQQKPHNTTRL
jgi:hypothetical protein